MSKRVIADFIGKIRTPGMNDFAKGRVILSRDQLLCVGSDERRRISLAGIHGLSMFDAEPGVDRFFESTLAVDEVRGEESSRVWVQAKPDTLGRFRDMLVKLIFRDERLRLWHPASVGGRVRRPSERSVTLSFGSDSLRFVDDETAIGAIEYPGLLRIVPGTTMPTQVDGPTVSIVHQREGRAYTTIVGADESRLCSVLKSYLKIHAPFDQRTIRELELEESHRRVLIWLYAGCPSTRLSNAVPDGTDLNAVLEQLGDADLITRRDGALGLSKRGIAAATQTYATAGVTLAD